MPHFSSHFPDYTYKCKNNFPAKQLGQGSEDCQNLHGGSQAPQSPEGEDYSCICLMPKEAASLEFYVGIVFSNVAQSRTSLSIWPWNAHWDSAKHVPLTTLGQNNKSKPQSDLALISELCSLMEPKIPNHPGGQQDSLKSE